MIKTPQSSPKLWFKAILGFDSQDLGGHIEPGTVIKVAGQRALVQHLVARGFLKPTLPHADDMDWTGLVDRIQVVQHVAFQELLNPVSSEANAGVSPVVREVQDCDQSDHRSKASFSTNPMLTQGPATDQERRSVLHMRGTDHISGAGRSSYIIASYICASTKASWEAEPVKHEEPLRQELINGGFGSQPHSVDELTFDLLVRRFEEIELQMAQSAERAKVEARFVEELKNIVLGIKARVAENERQLESTKSRASAAEARAAALQAAYDDAASQNVGAEILVSQFEQAISRFRKNREAQRNTGTCRKCGRITALSDFPTVATVRR